MSKLLLHSQEILVYEKGVFMILSCNNISKSFGTDIIIKSCSFNIEDHEKAAIVGIWPLVWLEMDAMY